MINEHTSDDTSSDTPTDASSSNRTRRFAALGLTAGLIGGGAIGLVATMPSLTSAASDVPAADVAATGVVAADLPTVVALQDDGETTDDAADDAAERPDRTERIREILQSLVDDETISADQADAVATHLAEQAPARGDRDGRRGGGKGFPGRGLGGEAVIEVLGIDAETLRDELRAGNSLADIATANGVDVQAVIDAMVAEATERLDAAVENERLTEDEAAEKLDELTERITDVVNGERPVRS